MMELIVVSLCIMQPLCESKKRKKVKLFASREKIAFRKSERTDDNRIRATIMTRTRDRKGKRKETARHDARLLPLLRSRLESHPCNNAFSLNVVEGEGGRASRLRRDQYGSTGYIRS